MRAILIPAMDLVERPRHLQGVDIGTGVVRQWQVRYVASEWQIAERGGKDNGERAPVDHESKLLHKRRMTKTQ